MDERAFQRDLGNWRTNYKEWSQDRLLTSDEAAGPIPIHPLRTSPQYNHKSFAEQGANTALTALKNS